MNPRAENLKKIITNSFRKFKKLERRHEDTARRHQEEELKATKWCSRKHSSEAGGNDFSLFLVKSPATVPPAVRHSSGDCSKPVGFSFLRNLNLKGIWRWRSIRTWLSNDTILQRRLHFPAAEKPTTLLLAFLNSRSSLSFQAWHISCPSNKFHLGQAHLESFFNCLQPMDSN